MIFIPRTAMIMLPSTSTSTLHLQKGAPAYVRVISWKDQNARFATWAFRILLAVRRRANHWTTDEEDDRRRA
jgi:hypothetical protein